MWRWSPQHRLMPRTALWRYCSISLNSWVTRHRPPNPRIFSGVSQVTETDHELAKEVTKNPRKRRKFQFFLSRHASALNLMSFNTGMSAGGRESFAVPSGTMRKFGSPLIARGRKKSYGTELMSHHFLIRLVLAAPEIHQDSSTGPILRSLCVSG